MKWVRVTRKSPCPICGRPDWCGVSEDGASAVCMRVESPKPCKGKSGGWFHKLSEAVYVPPQKPKQKPVAQKDFAPLAEKCRCALLDTPNGLQELSRELGLSVESLERLKAGWSAGGYTFPMMNGGRQVIGIRVRGTKKKWCIPGSHNGLFWPAGVETRAKALLLLPEGPTSCAACLDLGYDAIGRPNCQLGLSDLQAILRQSRRDVVIVADHDEAKKRPDGGVYYPGQDGARAIAGGIKPLCKTLKIVQMPFHKDPRDFLRAGGTREAFDCLIRAARFV